MSTKCERALQDEPVNLRGYRWFYITDGRGVDSCSFHNEQGHATGFPVTAILRALQARGLLRRWDQKQQVLKKDRK